MMAMSSDLHNVVPFDIDGDGLPEALGASLTDDSDAGLVLALLADPATRESGWAPRAAVALARQWSDAGHRVLLVDANLADPVLHALLDEPNGEGVADAVLYGVSPARMARTREEGFLFASAGTAVADPSSVLRHPRWRSVLSACRESGATVLLYLPGGTPGADSLAGEGDRVVRLRTALSASTGGVSPEHVVLHPPRSDAAGAAPAANREDPAAAEKEAPVDPAGTTDEASPDEGAAVGASTSRTGVQDSSGAPATGAEPEAEVPPGEAGTGGSRSSGLEPRPVKRRVSVLGVVLILLLLLLVGGVVVAALLGLLEVPGLTPPVDAALHPGHPSWSS